MLGGTIFFEVGPAIMLARNVDHFVWVANDPCDYYRPILITCTAAGQPWPDVLYLKVVKPHSMYLLVDPFHTKLNTLFSNQYHGLLGCSKQDSCSCCMWRPPTQPLSSWLQKCKNRTNACKSALLPVATNKVSSAATSENTGCSPPSCVPTMEMPCEWHGAPL